MDLPDASGCLAGCDCILAPAAAPDEARAAAAACPVWVHAYDVGHAHIVQGLDEPLRDLLGAGGVLFCAVEVGGAEWAYGGSRKDGSGVYACPPKKNPFHTYRTSVCVGDCALARAEVRAVLARLRGEWRGPDYDVRRRDCVAFADALCAALGVGEVPDLVRARDPALTGDGAGADAPPLEDAHREEVNALHTLEDRTANALCMDVIERDTQHFLDALDGPPPPPPEGEQKDKYADT